MVFERVKRRKRYWRDGEASKRVAPQLFVMAKPRRHSTAMNEEISLSFPFSIMRITFACAVACRLTDSVFGALVAWNFTLRNRRENRSEEHTSELQSLMRISYAVFCLKK